MTPDDAHAQRTLAQLRQGAADESIPERLRERLRERLAEREAEADDD